MEIKLSVGPLRAVRAGVPSIAADVLPIAGVARHVSDHILREVRFKGFVGIADNFLLSVDLFTRS
jgi:hypothetical protein